MDNIDIENIQLKMMIEQYLNIKNDYPNILNSPPLFV